MRRKKIFYVLLLVVLLASLLPVGGVVALSTEPVPPADFFQLPWEQGLAWYAIDGIDNGHKRPLSSSHNYSVGGAIDFAPRVKMYKGEDTSNFWVTAAGPGTVVATSTCHIILDHGNGWVTQYQFLGNIQVSLGQSVERNQRLGIIADGVRYRFCLGSVDPDIPHLHFMLRPTMLGATFAGWEVNYYSFFSSTTFTKDGLTVGLYKPLLNTFGSSSSTPTPTPSSTPPTSEVTPTSTHSPTPTPTQITPTPSGPHGSTDVDKPDIDIGETAVVTVRLNNIPPEGYTSAEFTCTYDPVVLEVGNITVTDLFGTDPAVAIQGPQNGEFIVAIAGSHGQKATTSGVAFTFNVTGLQAGQTTVECKVRVNTGDNVLTDLPSIGTVITVHGTLPQTTSTSTSTTPQASPTVPPFELTPTSTLPTFQGGMLTGQIFASKPVTIDLLNMDGSTAATVAANADGTFTLTAPAGTYTTVATSGGFLKAQAASVTLTDGISTALPAITLPAGDIDGNNVIDQFDAISIGINYNAAEPFAADLNNDGIINVLDLELLAGNYRKTGPVVWQ